MKRLTILIAVAMALLVAVPSALAVDRFYKGIIDSPNAGIEFHATIKNKVAKSVAHVEWFNVPVTCTPSGSSATNGGLGKYSMNVHDDGTFHGTKSTNGGSLTAKITGKFSHQTKKVVGTLRVHGAVAGVGGDCDTGVRTWKHLPK
jgi:hypothetical protein